MAEVYIVYSNTTLVKVKYVVEDNKMVTVYENLNTTLVKVKYNYNAQTFKTQTFKYNSC